MKDQSLQRTDTISHFIPLMVDFSQFSRGPMAVCFPKYWSSNLSALSWILPMDMPRISLDMSRDFYHILFYPTSAGRLAVSDEQLVYYFRKAAMGISISPFLRHLFSTAIATEISTHFNVSTFAWWFADRIILQVFLRL